MRLNSDYCGRQLTKSGFWVYYVRETSRDMLLKREPRVINILTNADLLQISKLFPDIVYQKNGREHSCFLPAKHPVYFFISDYPADRSVLIPGMIDNKKEACKRAAERFLFTIHSLAYDISGNMFYDPFDAYPHFKQKSINTIHQPEQSAKLFPTIALKTAKVVSETGFCVEKSLQEFLLQNKSLYNYKKIDESIAGDFLDILVSGRAYEALNLLNDWGVIDELLPEVALLKKVDQDKDHHPEGNGFWHTLECMKCVKRPNKALMMSLLLHDTGKALTKTDRKKSSPFPNHSVVSTMVAKDVLKRFYFTDDEIDEVIFLVKYHMILNAVDSLPERRLRKIFTSPFFPNLLELYRADLESGYHTVQRYYHAARVYREFLRKERLKQQGIYA